MSDAEIIRHVEVMSPQPGDLVAFRVEALTNQEFDGFCKSLTRAAEGLPGVTFVAMERVDGISVLRSIEPGEAELKRRARAADEAARAYAREHQDEPASQHYAPMVAAAASAWLSAAMQRGELFEPLSRDDAGYGH